jgi:DMSO/TMAO reductase YedYZ heme-binding membrane subunit
MRQGRHPRLRWVRWGLFTVLIVLIVGAAGPRAWDHATGWLRDEYERLPWYATRITALLSYLALTASVVYGLLLSTKILDRIAHRAVSFTLHQDLGSIGLALALAHAAVLMLDRSVPYTPTELLVPFSGPYRPIWVGIGQLTMLATVVVVVSFYLRKRTGPKVWRRLHYLAFIAFLGATIHGLMAGSDSGAEWVALGYLLAITLVAFLLTYRVVLAVADRRLLPLSRRPPGQGTAPSIPPAAAAASVPAPGWHPRPVSQPASRRPS